MRERAAAVRAVGRTAGADRAVTSMRERTPANEAREARTRVVAGVECQFEMSLSELSVKHVSDDNDDSNRKKRANGLFQSSYFGK